MEAEILLGAFAELGGKVDRLSRMLPPRPVYRSLTAGAVMPASGTALADLGGPASGRSWVIRALSSFEHLPGPPNIATPSATGAAGAAVSVSLPYFTPFMTGFDVSIGPAAAAGLATVTVTGSAQPPLTYYVEEQTTASSLLSLRFPSPGIPQQTVSVSAVASGGVVAVNVTGTQTGSPANVSWFMCAPPPGGEPPLASGFWQGSLNAQFQTFPEFDTFTSDVFTVSPPDHILAWIQGAIPGENIIVKARVAEYRTGDLAAEKI